MFFFGLIVFLLFGWFLPWWGLAAGALALGIMFPKHSVWGVTIAAAIAWASLAYVKDGMSHGLISLRMSGLLGLPAPPLMFVVMAVIAAITAFLFFGTGRSLRSRLSA